MQVRQMDPFGQRERRARETKAPLPPAPLPLPLPEPAPEAGGRSLTDLFTNFNIKDFKTDDWILLGIIGALILEGSRDYVLLCSLGYLFLMGL